ncbi:MAG: terminase small subunit [Deltaproteobacteria bacterium]|nr:terminase small subunit [Deltaproteobacteria bacterium]
MTPRQQQFVVEYAICGNAADAARRAGYSANGANVTGAQLLANPSIKSAITIERQRNAKKLDIRKEEVIGGQV